MSSKFRKFVMLVMAAAISLSLVGCGNGGSSDDDRTVEVLYTGWNNIAMESDYDKNPYKSTSTRPMTSTIRCRSQLICRTSWPNASALPRQESPM